MNVSFNLEDFKAVSVNSVTKSSIENNNTLFINRGVGSRTWQFKNSSSGGSKMISDVPLTSKMAGLIEFTTKANNSNNVFSLVDGQNGGLALWWATSNSFALSIFNSAGAEERHVIGAGFSTNGTTVNKLRFLIFNNAGIQTIKVWNDQTLLLTDTSSVLIDGFLFQLGQFKNLVTTRLNSNSPNATEGINKATIWNISGDTQPTDEEVLALENPTQPVYDVQRYDSVFATNMAGYIVVYPLNYDGVTPLKTIVHGHGAGDGRNVPMSLSDLSEKTGVKYLKDNPQEGLLNIFLQSNNYSLEGTRIQDSLNYLNGASGIYKAIISEIHAYGYSAGAIGWATFVNQQTNQFPNVKSYTLVAGLIAGMVGRTDEMIANNVDLWLFSCDDDEVAGSFHSNTVATEWAAQQLGGLRYTSILDLPPKNGSVHAAMEDLVYNGSAKSDDQDSGNFGGVYPYYVWSEGSYWDYIRSL